MNKLPLLIVLPLAAACGGPAATPPDVDPAPASDAAPAADHIDAVPFTAVTLQDGFWQPRFERNREVTIPHIMEQNELTGRVDNFRKGAGMMEGAYEGRRFNDTDIYKVVEAASYAINQQPDPELEARLDALIALIGAAQQPDGYLFPALTIDPENPAPGVGTERWMHVSAGSHELYNAGHLIEAAVAHYQATGKESLLDIAIRFADRIDEDFGPDARHDIPGHEEVELALVKLADVTGEVRYLELAKFFLDQRGQEHDGALYPEDTDFAIYNDLPYKQDHMPVTAQTKASGHAVRASYLYAGMADVAARTEAPGYEEALEAIWNDIVTNKLYLTGSIGARGTFESFGEDYELPNRAYGETCAAVGFDQWNHRMFLATGDVEYLDVMERTLYNGFLSGVSHAGDTFFYTNVLESSGRDQRAEYFEVACCPANLARMMALLPGFVYARKDDRVYVNLYVGSEADVELPDGTVHLRQETDYPWDGMVRLEVDGGDSRAFELALRIPGWARDRPVPSDLYRFTDGIDAPVELRINGDTVQLPAAGSSVSGPRESTIRAAGGLIVISRAWQPGDFIELILPMPVRTVGAHPLVEDAVGKVALQRGPLVYAAEAIDNDGSVLDLSIEVEPEFETSFESELLGGVTIIRGRAARSAWAGPSRHTLVAIPYFAWANRGAGEMAVWLPILGDTR
jgi:DUF1680 family protein